MKHWWLIGLWCVSLGLFPSAASAAIIINEVAWMGTAVSANDEWIELYNTGDTPVSVDGWTLSDGQALSITLAGTIEGQQYAVLERTDDESAPGTAFLIYTGALPNTGATLALRDAANNLIDQVGGGENWENIGGDNTTKETAQYTSGGWITAVATPGAVNRTAPTQPAAENKPAPTSGGGSGSVIARPTTETRTLIPSTAELQLAIDRPERVYVNQPITLEAVPSNIGDTVKQSLTYEWNLGDLTTHSGKEITHTFTHPGEYIIAVRAHFARHDTLLQQPITVLPVRFSLTRTLAGDVLVHNDAPYTVDVSGFSLVGERSVTFPPRSFISQNGTVSIAAAKIGGDRHGQYQLRDQAGQLVATLSTVAVAQESMANTVAQISRSAVPPVITPVAVEQEANAFMFARPASAAEADTETETEVVRGEEVVLPTAAASVFTGAATQPEAAWPLLGLLGIIFLGLISVYAGAQKS